jgi:hypothetical protein
LHCKGYEPIGKVSERLACRALTESDHHCGGLVDPAIEFNELEPNRVMVVIVRVVMSTTTKLLVSRLTCRLGL